MCESNREVFGRKRLGFFAHACNRVTWKFRRIFGGAILRFLGGILGAEKICGELSCVLIKTIGENGLAVLVTKFII